MHRRFVFSSSLRSCGATLPAISVIVGVLGIAPGCDVVPPTNPCDPDVDVGQQGAGRITGTVVMKMKREEKGTPADEGAVTLVLNDGTTLRNAKDGAFSVDVTPGLRSITFERDGFVSVRTSLIDVAACEVVAIDEPVELVDASNPSPLSITPPPPFVSDAELTIHIDAHATDSNMAWYEYRVSGGNWESLDEWMVDEWTIALEPNRRNVIAYRAVDWMRNVSAEGFVETTHDDVAPTVPTLDVVNPGPERVDLGWSASVDENLSHYEVCYGDAPALCNGTIANEGPAPIRVVDEPRLRLSGLVNDHVLYVSVTAVDLAGNRSDVDVASFRPGIVTPVLSSTAPLVERAARFSLDGDRGVVVDESGDAHLVDARDGDIILGAVPLVSGVNDAAIEGTRVVAVTETQALIYDVTRLETPVLLGTVLVTDEIGCETCVLTSVDVTLGTARVLIRDGRVWHVDVRAASSAGVLNIANVVSNEVFTGPLRRFGQYLAAGFVDPANLDAANVAIIDTFGTIVCANYRAENSNNGNEVFFGDGITTRSRPNFAVDGKFLVMAHDGSAVVMRLSDPFSSVAEQCTASFFDGFPEERRTLDHAVGRFDTGLLTVNAVAMSGNTLAVSSAQRSTALPAESRVDVISLSPRQDELGAQSGIIASLPVVGRIDDDARALLWRGPSLIAVGDDVSRYDVFHPTAPRFVTSVGENPTGMNTVNGTQVIHQRTDRGVGIWDFSRASTPTIENGSTCVPGCFTEQALAGDAVVVDGLLVSAFSKPDEFGVAVTDVASNVAAPFSVATVNNPCVGRARGFVVDGARGFLGCAAENLVHSVDLSHPELGIELVASALLPANILPAPVRDLAIVDVGSGATLVRALVVLDDDASLTILSTHVNLANPPTVLTGVTAPDLGFDFGLSMTAVGRSLFVVGGTSVNACDPAFAGCVVLENRVVEIETEGFTVVNTHVTGAGEPKQTLRAYDDFVVLGRGNAGYNYEFRRRDDFSILGIAGPNPLPLDAAVTGGHLVSAGFQIFALE